MSRWSVVWCALLLLAVPAAVSSQTLGVAAPGFDLPALDGSTVSLGELRGRPVVLHFGAGW